ncbi:phage portal protein [Paracoccus sulfuroxidans]|uniref:HK97 family phage portal protein n=1 Tax=Paracoccus sulfuroxidans TaxID=384678 RepID=A0A562P1C1_9RHOB|nr:phage portal protein [Paracoccus sulfuroxidans]TWI38235.1 HK97 family phage portal protein [Paracoccus sulfuroxidans]
MFGLFEKKKATVFSGGRGLLSTVFGVTQGRSGGPVNLDDALETSLVFSVARVIAEDVAKTPLRLIKDTKDGTRVVHDHWAHQLLTRRPNSWMTAFEFIEQMTFCAVLGRGAISIKVMSHDRKQVSELIPVPPGAWEIEQSDDYGIRYRVTFLNGRVQYFGQEEVFAFRGVSLDGVSGIPAFQKARRAIGITQALENQQATLAENGGRPSGILSFKGEVTSETRTALREMWQKLFGPGGPGGVAVLDQEASYTPMTLSLVDSQYIESRRFLVEEIARVFRVQPIMLGQADKAATYASAEQMFRAHVINTIMPWCRRIELALDRDILGQTPGMRFDFDEIELMRGDQAAQAEYFTKALGAGGQPAWMSVDEVRREVGLNPVNEEWTSKPSRGAMNSISDPEKKV